MRRLMKMEHIIFRNNKPFCSHCGQYGEMDLPIELEKYLLFLDSFGKKHKDCEQSWVEPQPDMSLPLDERIKFWLDNGDRGVSSETMLAVCFGSIKPNMYGTPRDANDFYRCYKLLKCLPEMKTRFHLLRNLPKWERIIDNWDNLEKMLEKMIAGEKSEDLYNFLNGK